MSRKESLKKSLGLSEYPWSSDDDENNNPQIASDIIAMRRLSAEPRQSVADMPGTSGLSQEPPTSEATPVSASQQAKLDRELFWSHLANPITSPIVTASSSRINDVIISSLAGTVTHTPVPELSEMVNPTDTASADMRRMQAFRKFCHNMQNKMRQHKLRTTLYAMSSRGTPGSVRNNITTTTSSASSTGPIMSTSQIQHRQGLRPILRPIRMLPYHRNVIGRRGVCGRGTWPGVARRTNSQAGSDSPRVMPYTELLPRIEEIQLNPVKISSLLSLIGESNASTEDTAQAAEVSLGSGQNETNSTQETAPTGALALEEEIVELDGTDESDSDRHTERGPENNNDDNENDREPVNNSANATPPAEVKVSPRGIKRQRKDSDGRHLLAGDELNVNLLQLLECPVCMDSIEPPIAQCRRGHLICSHCRPRLTCCPICRTFFSSVRNRAMESVAEMLRYPCRHGCGREVRLRRRKHHEANCLSRRYQCPVTACRDVPHMLHHDLALHLQSQHMSIVKIGQKHNFSIRANAEQHDTWLIMALDEFFQLKVDADVRTTGLVVYVSYIGPKSKSHSYTYEVSMEGKYNSRKLIYSRETHNDFENTTQNQNRQDCFHLSQEQAVNFISYKNRHSEPEKYLDFRVEISKIEPKTESPVS